MVSTFTNPQAVSQEALTSEELRKIDAYWRSHQVPMGWMHSNDEHVKLLEQWMKGYRPEELFDENGTSISELKELAPVGARQMSASPIANGGLLRKDLTMPDFRGYAVEVDRLGNLEVENTRVLGKLMKDETTDNLAYAREHGLDKPEIVNWTWTV